MKKVFVGMAGVALTVAMTMGLAGCGGNGAIAQARNIQGEEVSEEQWITALTEVSDAEIVGIAEGEAAAGTVRSRRRGIFRAKKRAKSSGSRRCPK